jgi:hypothetical protein
MSLGRRCPAGAACTVVRVREFVSIRPAQIPGGNDVSQARCDGIDVAQATLNIAVCQSAVTWQVTNDDTGIITLASRLNAELLGPHDHCKN